MENKKNIHFPLNFDIKNKLFTLKVLVYENKNKIKITFMLLSHLLHVYRPLTKFHEDSVNISSQNFHIKIELFYQHLGAQGTYINRIVLGIYD